MNFSSSKCLVSFIAQIPLHENTTRWQKWGAGTSKVLHICHKYHLPLLFINNVGIAKVLHICHHKCHLSLFIKKLYWAQLYINKLIVFVKMYILGHQINSWGVNQIIKRYNMRPCVINFLLREVLR